MQAVRTSRTLAVAAWVGAVGHLGCTSESVSPFGETSVAVTGEWAGAIVVGEETFPTTLDVSQAGGQVVGTVTAVGAFENVRFEGAVDANRRVVYLIEIGCVEWGGIMTVSEDARQMAGTTRADRTCLGGEVQFGTIDLTKQSL